MTNFFEPRLNTWLEARGEESDVVLSSRVRIARNLPNKVFPVYLQKEQTIDSVFGSLDESFQLLKLNDMQMLEKALLVEKHFISPYLMSKSEHGAVAINEKQNLSIMINEEDHIRIQSMVSGLNLEEALEKALQVENAMEAKLGFAYDEQFGYLTSCVTNVGTGLRASAMAHLPGLVTTKQIKKMIEAIRHLGFVVRGMYGEGSLPSSNIFQISNQVTLGKTELEIIEDLTEIVMQVIMQERVARTMLKQKYHIALEDRIFRAYGLLENCRMITEAESSDAISDLRLGVELGYLEHITREKVNELVIFSQPAFLRQAAGHDLNDFEEKVIRARVIRDLLEKNES